MPLAEIKIKNVDNTLKLLKGYAPQQAKIINKKISIEANKIKNRAIGYFPDSALSNWNNWPAHQSWGYNGAIVKKNIRITRANMRQRGLYVSNFIAVVNRDAAGSIFQTVGRGGSDDYFVQNIVRDHPEPRGLWKAFDELKGEVAPAIEAAVHEAENIVNAKLNQLGGE